MDFRHSRIGVATDSMSSVLCGEFSNKDVCVFPELCVFDVRIVFCRSRIGVATESVSSVLCRIGVGVVAF